MIAAALVMIGVGLVLLGWSWRRQAKRRRGDRT